MAKPTYTATVWVGPSRWVTFTAPTSKTAMQRANKRAAALRHDYPTETVRIVLAEG